MRQRASMASVKKQRKSVSAALLVTALLSSCLGCQKVRYDIRSVADNIAVLGQDRNIDVLRPLRATIVSGEIIPYSNLGWHTPENGDAILRRFHEVMGTEIPLQMLQGFVSRAQWSIVVNDRNWIYIVKSGDRLPGIEDDLVVGRVKITPLGGDRGTVQFDPLDDKGFARLGSGIALPVGSQLEIEPVSWNGLHFDSGTLVLQAGGVEWKPKSE